MRLGSFFAEYIDIAIIAVICFTIISAIFVFLACFERTKRYRSYLVAGAVFVVAAYGSVALLVAAAISYRLYWNAFSLILSGIAFGMSFSSLVLIRICRDL